MAYQKYIYVPDKGYRIEQNGMKLYLTPVDGGYKNISTL